MSINLIFAIVVIIIGVLACIFPGKASHILRPKVSHRSLAEVLGEKKSKAFSIFFGLVFIYMGVAVILSGNF
jgi:uncharacterized membrane protein